MNFYKILSVSPDASVDEIESAFREQIKKHHPDTDGASSQRKTKQLTVAKEVLTDPDERAAYDRLGHTEYVQKHYPNCSYIDEGSSLSGTQRSGQSGASKRSPNVTDSRRPTGSASETSSRSRTRQHASHRTQSRTHHEGKTDGSDRWWNGTETPTDGSANTNSRQRSQRSRRQASPSRSTGAARPENGRTDSSPTDSTSAATTEGSSIWAGIDPATTDISILASVGIYALGQYLHGITEQLWKVLLVAAHAALLITLVVVWAVVVDFSLAYGFFPGLLAFSIGGFLCSLLIVMHLLINL